LIGETRRLQDGRKQNEAATGIFMSRHLQHRGTQFRIGAERFRTFDQPEVQPFLGRAQIRYQLGVKSLRVIDEISGMHFEEVGQQHPGRVGQMLA